MQDQYSIETYPGDSRQPARIYLNGPITYHLHGELMVLLRRTEAAFNNSQVKHPKQVFLHINSPGGDLFTGLALLGEMRTLEFPLYTVAGGICANAATLLLLGGKERYALGTSQIIIDKIDKGDSVNWGQGIATHKDEWVDQLSVIFAEATNQLKEVTRVWVMSGKRLKAQEAYNIGLVQQIFR